MKQALAVLPETPASAAAIFGHTGTGSAQPTREPLTYVNKEQASEAPYAKKEGGPIEAAWK
jgi:hypothetical protein